mgnify:CR=1 FL=1
MLFRSALEAARQTEEKYLYISMILRKGVLKVKVENSFLDGSTINMKSEDGKMIWKSTKKEKEQHGIGLKNVRKIVDTYNGTMEIKVYDNVFCVKLILYMTKVENEV